MGGLDDTRFYGVCFLGFFFSEVVKTGVTRTKRYETAGMRVGIFCCILCTYGIG